MTVTSAPLWPATLAATAATAVGVTAAAEYTRNKRPLRLLVANRGEIVLRIRRAAALFPRPETPDLAFEPIAVYTRSECAPGNGKGGSNSVGDEDAVLDPPSHAAGLPAAQRLLLPGDGPRAYLD
ncbi:hypothetical protein HK405_014291, partial [Cladochytrium tenue]